MMQRALKEVGIDRAASAMALFEKAPRKAPLIGKVVGVGMVDEITDRTWVILDAVDGRVHYAELGRLQPGAVPARGMIAALGGGPQNEKPNALPRLHILSPVSIERLASYEGPTWLDEAILAKWRPDPAMPGVAAELRSAIAARADWLAGRGLATIEASDKVTPSPDMMTSLRKMQTERLVANAVQGAERRVHPLRTRPPRHRRLCARDQHPDRQDRRHPPPGHLHPGALETGARTSAWAASQRQHRSQSRLLDLGSRTDAAAASVIRDTSLSASNRPDPHRLSPPHRISVCTHSVIVIA